MILTSASFESNLEKRTCVAMALEFDEMYQDDVHMKMRVERDVPPNRRQCVDGESLIVKMDTSLIGKSLMHNKENVTFNRGGSGRSF